MGYDMPFPELGGFKGGGGPLMCVKTVESPKDEAVNRSADTTNENTTARSLDPKHGGAGPFSLLDGDAYARWRDQKLENFPTQASELLVDVKDLNHLTDTERAAVRSCVNRAGMCIYKGPALDGVEPSKDAVRALGLHFGLERLDQNPYADEDAITPLHVAAGEDRVEAGRKLYIPYTDRAINWHTDGYYNTPARRICAMTLHCVRQAGGQGGENQLFDPEMAYLLMRERDPELVAAFCRDDAMTIPGNDMDDHVTRGDVGGPVFSLNKDGSLYMRYTARLRNIVWADDLDTQRAVAFMQEILGGPHTFSHRLSAGEGVICNNVLHTRTTFRDTDEPEGQRMMLRARYLERIHTDT